MSPAEQYAQVLQEARSHSAKCRRCEYPSTARPWAGCPAGWALDQRLLGLDRARTAALTGHR
jgi:hypothetical protein